MGGPFPLRRSTTQDFQYSSGFHQLRRIISMPSVRIVVCVFMAFCFFNDVASYNPYRYNAQFFPSINQDSYATMGDIDWSKRRNQNDPESDFGMSDADWGWSWGQKKRSDEKNDDDRWDNFGMSDADWGWGWGQKKRSGYQLVNEDQRSGLSSLARNGALRGKREQ